MMTRLFQKLEQRAQVVQPGSQSTPTNQCNLQEVRSKIAAAKRNLAFASFQAAFSAVESALTDLLEQERVLSQQMPLAAKTRQVQLEFCRTSGTAVDFLHSLPRLSDDVNNLGAVGQLVQVLDGQLFLRFTKVQRVKRLENRVAGGILTLGSVPAPIEKYTGPTGRRAVRKSLEVSPPSGAVASANHLESVRETKSSRNVSRDDRI